MVLVKDYEGIENGEYITCHRCTRPTIEADVCPFCLASLCRECIRAHIEGELREWERGEQNQKELPFDESDNKIILPSGYEIL